MPLFDSLEREVSTFFVAQGSIIDTILKTVLERLAHVETRVDAGLLTIHNIAQGLVGHGTALPNSTSDGGDGHHSQDELEYCVMTLARQLNVVLALLFQPYVQDAVARTLERQQHWPSISHVLSANEAMLMGLAVSKTDDSESPATSAEESQDDDRTPVNNTANDQGHGDQPAMTAVHAASTFTMIHQLHSAEAQRQRQEQVLLDRMTRRLHESQAACQAQCKALHDRNDTLLRELQHQHEKLSAEWAYQQQKHASNELSHAQLQSQQQKELEKQLLACSNTFLASQTTQEKQIARILDHLRDVDERFVRKADLDSLAVNWLQTARDDCVYGADLATLTQFQHDLLKLQQALNDETPSPALTRLTDEVTNVTELVEKLLKLLETDSTALHGASGSQSMQSLRRMVAALEELAHDANADTQATRRPSAVFLTDFLRHMELGTASLLDAIENQQDSYQRALSQQQAELDLLKLELQTQKLSDEELKQQLTACPNQEDTMRLVNALKDQILASTSDSASRMLETVGDLRNSVAGLPTHDFLEELLHSKADRSEIDRLCLLLAEQALTGPGAPSLSKSPTRCLSCDQSLPFMQSRPNSASHQHHAIERPASAGAASPSRPSSRGSSPTRGPHHHSMVALPSHHTHVPDNDEPHDDHELDRNRFVSPFTRAMFLVSENGIPSTQEILRDLSANIEATKRRRQRMHDQQDQLAALAEERTLMSFAAAGSSASRQRKSVAVLGTPGDERKNKIPLRRTTLSDHVVYGPSITLGVMKPRKSITPSTTSGPVTKASPGSARRDSDESKMARPKTAVNNERRGIGGDVILRAPSTTVVIRPFSETGGRTESGGRRNTRGV